MTNNIYAKKMIVSPDYCDVYANLSPIGIFIIFQAVAAEHAELLGIGISAIVKQKKFWVTAHNRIDFYERMPMMSEITAETWAQECSPDSFKCYRQYSLSAGDKLIALGKTQWVILGADGKPLPFAESGFPAEYEFSTRVGIEDDPQWFKDDLAEEDFKEEFTVKSTDIDFGRHMNNIAYVRKLLDVFASKQIAAGAIKSIEIHYGSPCLENSVMKIYSKNEGNQVKMAIKDQNGKAQVMASIIFNA